ncbi:hypothetical protein B0A48_04537 [Cryoendolithus antarcticus]|uniref:DUF218 domain-containing protein n=1 Tax=Cryoendolithus antarcticus TaxID=1507870 RepID=A0A1V8TFM6_9PEZI|nr:hypothetical protein B0A48_04537 [Cryoendolithus antarcticus]
MTDSSPAALARAINTISTFISHDELPGIDIPKSSTLVFCVPSILSQATYIFRTLERDPTLIDTLVLVGGIGHATSYIYDAVARHPEYQVLARHIDGLPEARVLELILRRFFDVTAITSAGCQILIEDQSTNCGANAVETKALLEREGVRIGERVVVVQDPTMCRRTVASFEKLYEELPQGERPTFVSFPVVVPTVEVVDGKLEYAALPAGSGVKVEELWEKQRFYELLVGEVARLHDDENGYGPKGKGFTGHVDVPKEVLAAAEVLRSSLGVTR